MNGVRSYSKIDVIIVFVVAQPKAKNKTKTESETPIRFIVHYDALHLPFNLSIHSCLAMSISFDLYGISNCLCVDTICRR